MVAYLLPLYVEKTSVPSAAISTTDPWLEKSAYESSSPLEVAGPPPPHFPLLSAAAETVIAAGVLAGVKLFASLFSFLLQQQQLHLYYLLDLLLLFQVVEMSLLRKTHIITSMNSNLLPRN
jgi:hypothetical protein